MSSTGGKATYKGVNAQSWAALSLFLQYVKSANLDYIAFEQDKLKDFDLVFTSGRKIICESKTNRVTHGVLKEILGKLIDNEKVGKEDEILIICKELSSVLESDVENMKYFLEIKDRLKKKGFTNSHLELFSKIKFWKVDQNANEEIVTTLLAEILGVWFPDKIFDEIVSNILISRVYKGSQSSEVFTRNEFYQMIEERKKQVQEDAGYKNEQT